MKMFPANSATANRELLHKLFGKATVALIRKETAALTLWMAARFVIKKIFKNTCQGVPLLGL